jgi:homoserine dehydrogenase
MKILIVGKGAVGTALSQSASMIGWQYRFFSGRSPDRSFVREAESADVVAIAISTKDKGEIELGFIMICLELGIPVVTCAKGALAWHFEKLKPHLQKIGHSTTVGGASGMLALAESPGRWLMTQADGIVNGTLNFLCWAAGKGIDPYAALAYARKHQLCEPGAMSLATVVNGEIQDVLRKASILFNLFDIGPSISPDDFSYSVFAEEEVLRLLRFGRCMRFVLTISRTQQASFSFEAVHLTVQPWTIVGSFFDCPEDTLIGTIDRERNFLSITTPEIGIEVISGIGAGAQSTAVALLEEARCLFRAA